MFIADAEKSPGPICSASLSQRQPDEIFVQRLAQVRFVGGQFANLLPQRLHLIFLLVTPAEQPTFQVLLLAQVARLAGDPEVRRRLRAAESAAEVVEVVAAGAISSADGKPAN